MEQKTILLSPWSKPLRNGKQNAKNYPFWDDVVSLLNKYKYNTIQVGMSGEKKLACSAHFFDRPFSELSKILVGDICWISVDNFFQHFAHYHKKPGVVIFGPSDPLIFGYADNMNILKDRKYLRPDQFGIWEQCEYKEEAFNSAEVIVDAIKTFSIK